MQLKQEPTCKDLVRFRIESALGVLQHDMPNWLVCCCVDLYFCLLKVLLQSAFLSVWNIQYGAIHNSPSILYLWVFICFEMALHILCQGDQTNWKDNCRPFATTTSHHSTAFFTYNEGMQPVWSIRWAMTGWAETTWILNLTHKVTFLHLSPTVACKKGKNVG